MEEDQRKKPVKSNEQPGIPKKEKATVEAEDNEAYGPELPSTLNEELAEKIKDNPNKFIGCGS